MRRVRTPIFTVNLCDLYFENCALDESQSCMYNMDSGASGAKKRSRFYQWCNEVLSTIFYLLLDIKPNKLVSLNYTNVWCYVMYGLRHHHHWRNHNKKIPAALRFFAPRRTAVHIIHTDLAFIESTIFKIINHKDYLVSH